ncbi:hypothetical protein [Salinispora arenicola]|uniref:hypothetical protein n=1 Tax=Salinispora arenicola TaxID=168697 RepID=UPI00037CB53B|nr:hypothetical protein [Salinispora arenicola]
MRPDEETLDGDALAAAPLKVLAELLGAAAGLFGANAPSAQSTQIVNSSVTGRRWQSMQTG